MRDGSPTYQVETAKSPPLSPRRAKLSPRSPRSKGKQPLHANRSWIHGRDPDSPVAPREPLLVRLASPESPSLLERMAANKPTTHETNSAEEDAEEEGQLSERAASPDTSTEDGQVDDRPTAAHIVSAFSRNSPPERIQNLSEGTQVKYERDTAATPSPTKSEFCLDRSRRRSRPTINVVSTCQIYASYSQC